MQIDAKLIEYLEDLSYLTLSEEEKERLTVDLAAILDGMKQLETLDTGGVPECSHTFANVNVFREDAVSPSLDRALILQNAPQRNNETFIAPKTVE